MLVFQTPGHLDPKLLSTFGLSVKLGDNPIGKFGTGIKYAFATILRSGGSIEIHTSEGISKIILSPIMVRGKMCNEVCLSRKGKKTPLGFVSTLGSHWLPWMALRELWSNTQDEQGSITDAIDPEYTGTQIIVREPQFEAAYADLHKYILQTKPLATFGSLEIHPGSNSALFFRGIRAKEINKPSLFTYNLLKGDLTEDRTLTGSSENTLQYYLSLFLNDPKAEKSIVRAIISGNDHYEGDIPFQYWISNPSEQLSSMILDCDREEKLCNLNLRNIALNSEYNSAFEEVELSAEDTILFERAKAAMLLFGYHSLPPIIVTNALTCDVLGQARKRNGEPIILLNHSVLFPMGEFQIIRVLLEELVHHETGFSDCSRSLQNYLFQKWAEAVIRPKMIEESIQEIPYPDYIPF